MNYFLELTKTLKTDTLLLPFNNLKNLNNLNNLNNLQKCLKTKIYLKTNTSCFVIFQKTMHQYFQDSAQGFHWNTAQATIHLFVIYYGQNWAKCIKKLFSIQNIEVVETKILFELQLFQI